MRMDIDKGNRNKALTLKHLNTKTFEKGESEGEGGGTQYSVTRIKPHFREEKVRATEHSV